MLIFYTMCYTIFTAQPEKVYEFDESRGTGFCYICNKGKGIALTSEAHAADHIRGANHKKNLKRIRESADLAELTAGVNNLTIKPDSGKAPASSNKYVI